MRDATAFTWIQVPASGALTLEREVDGLPVESIDVSLQGNDPTLDQVSIDEPANLALVDYGSRLPVVFSATDVNDELRYVEINLNDESGDVVAQTRVANASGELSLQIPRGQSLSDFQLHVRAYYGDAYRYSDSRISLRVRQPADALNVALQTTPTQWQAGTVQSVAIDTALTSGDETSVRVIDAAGVQVASAQEQLQLTVDGSQTHYDIIATVSDANGTEQVQQTRVQVINRWSLDNVQDLFAFDHAAMGINANWFSRDSALLDEFALERRRFDTPITQLASHGRYLYVALQSPARLVALDTGAQLGSVASLDLDASVTAMRVVRGELLVVSDGKLHRHTLSGNNIGSAQAVELQSGPVTDMAEAKGGVYVLGVNGIEKFDLQWQKTTFINGDYQQLLNIDEQLYARHAERIDVYDSSLQLRNTLPVPTTQLIAGPGLALGVQEAGNYLALIDVRIPYNPQLLGARAMTAGTPSPDAFVEGAELWLGGNTGAILSVAPTQSETDAQPTQLYRSPSPQGRISSLQVDAGEVVAAAGAYGALHISAQDNFYSEQVFPAAYASRIAQARVVDNTRYVLDQDARQIVAYTSNGQSQVLMQGEDFSALHVDSTHVFASVGDTLVWRDTAGAAGTFSAATAAGISGASDVAGQAGDAGVVDSNNPSGRIQIAANENIVSITGSAQQLLLSTDQGSVYRLSLARLQNESAARVIQAVLRTSEPVRLLQSDGDRLMYAMGSTLYVQTMDGSDASQLTFNAPIVDLAYRDGMIWLIDGLQLSALPVDQINLQSVRSVSIDAQQLTALAVDSYKAYIGLGNDGVAIYDIPVSWTATGGVLNLPEPLSVIDSNARLAFSLADTGKVRSVQYRVNDTVVANATRPPFDAVGVLPGELGNGQSAIVTAEVESWQGNRRTLGARRLLIQSDANAANPMSATLQVQDAYLPSPVQVQVSVQDSTESIARVEFYRASSAQGPFDQFASGSYPAEPVRFLPSAGNESGFVFARVVDVRGNSIDSVQVAYSAIRDTEPPEASIQIVGTMIEGMLGANQSVSAVVTAVDADSAVASAVLIRDGAIVARSDGGNFSVPLLVGEPGSVMNLELIVTDLAGNITRTVQQLDVILDAPPVIARIVAPSQVREGQGFDVGVVASDDAAIAWVEVVWAGNATRLTGYPANIRIEDQRAQRLVNTREETLSVRVSDAQGNVAESSTLINVIPDSVPDADQLIVTVPAFAFYGEQFPIEITGFQSADDAPWTELDVTLLNARSGQILARPGIANRCGQPCVVSAVVAPLSGEQDNTLSLAVRISDSFAQTATTAARSVTLLNRPRSLVLASTVVANENPDSIVAGQPLVFLFEVQDAAGNPVAGQNVDYMLEGQSYTAASDSNGIARIELTAPAVVNQYDWNASVSGLDGLVTDGRLDVIAGALDELRFARIRPAAADGNFQLSFEALDTLGNQVNNDNAQSNETSAEDNTTLKIELSDGSLGFAASDAVRIDNAASLPTAFVSAHAGSIEVIAGPTVGNYVARVTRENGQSLRLTHADITGAPIPVSELPLNVLAGNAVRFGLSVHSIEHNALGDAQALEVGETATLRATLTDLNGEPVTTVTVDDVERDANFTAIVQVIDTDEETTLSESPLTIVRGVGSFDFDSDVPVNVMVSISDLAPIDGLISFDERLALSVKPLPVAIESTGHQVVDDDEIAPLRFTFTDNITMPEDTLDIGMVKDDEGESLPGSYRVEEQDLLFEPVDAYALGECFNYDTADSGLQSETTGDRVLEQQGTVCAPDVRMTLPESEFALEGRLLTLAGANFTQELNASSIYWGRLRLLDRYSASFDWADLEATLPQLNLSTFEDGQSVLLSFEGTYSSRALAVANRLTYRLLHETGDLDNDGLPNALEMDLAMNPDSIDSDADGIADGDEDLDGDGISNADEVLAGTELDNIDTDGDGISDGDEILNYQTDPTQQDSDGDGLGDALEIAVGSSPVDAQSRDVSAFVTALSIEPSTINGYLIESQQFTQLSVQARVTVGEITTDVDVSEDIWGTAYSVTDEAILVHRGDGQLEFLSAGQATLSVALGEQSVDVPVTVYEPTSLGNYTLSTGEEQLEGDFVALSISITDATLSIDGSLTVLGDMSLNDGAVLTVPDAVTDDGRIFPLDLDVHGTLSIDEGASINLDGKGYPPGRLGPDFRRTYSTSERCHGGAYSTVSGCEYGDYRRPLYAGSGGYIYRSDVEGGGYAHIRAGALVVDGDISADGLGGSTYGGAGGGLLIEAGQLSGTSSAASISANGADTSYPAAGGRVALWVDSDSYVGQVSARSGDGYYTTPGAGTVYQQIGSGDGTLIVDNGDNSSFDASTTVRSVGRHRIESITALPDNQWQIEREHFKASFDGVLASANETGSIAYHSISVDEQTSIELVLQRSSHSYVRVYQDDGDLDTDDRIASFTVLANDSSAKAFSVDQGNYIVVVAPYRTTEAQVVEGYNNEGISPYNYPGVYQLELQQASVWADSAGENNGLGIAGLSVSLEATDETSPLYRVVSNSGHTLVVQSSDELSVYTGNELQGVHRLDTLQVTGGASVSFGEDRVQLTGEQPLTVAEDSSLSVHEFSSQTLNTIAQEEQPGRIDQHKMPDALESLTIADGEWAYDKVALNSLILQDGATLLSNDVTLSGNLLLESGARLTIEPAIISGSVLNTLNLSVDGTLEVASGAHIDLDGKGYPRDYRGPDFQYQQSSSHLCHGGRVSADTACEYGSYISPQFAGSGGLSSTSDIGGGFARLQAGSLILNGTISADSEGTSYSGAGGGLMITADELSGGESGLISASAGNNSYRAGPGGRVSVDASRMDYQGQINVQTGVSRQVLDEYAGAGTYYQSAGVDGRRLHVDNGGIVSVRDGTTLPNVGRHIIASVEDLGNNLWRVQRQRFTRQFENELAAANEPGSIAYHTFELDQAMDIELSIDSDNRALAQIYRNDGLLDSLDRVIGFTFNNYPTDSRVVSLEPGAYIVALAGQSTGSRELIDGYVSGEARSSRFLGSYALELTATNYWTSSDEANGGFGLQDLQVTLDAENESSPLFTIISNDVNSLVVQSSADLNANVGKQLRGVHEFDELQITGGASVSFGDDRVHVQNMETFVVDNTASLSVGEFSQSTQSALLSEPADGVVEVQRISNVPQSLTLANGEWRFDSLSVDTLTLNEGASLEVSQLDVTGNLIVQDGAKLIINTANLGADVTLMPGAVLSVPDTDDATGRVSALELTVAGTLHVQQGAHIDLNGKGYPTGYRGPDFTSSSSRLTRCHGGRAYTGTACEYGSYKLPAYAGSGGNSTDRAGGGFGHINANTLIVDGSISADGGNSGGSYGGAGGGLRLQANTFSGASGAVISANGASTDYPGPGGRVSIAADSDNFAGDVQVRAGTGRYSDGSGGRYLLSSDCQR